MTEQQIRAAHIINRVADHWAISEQIEANLSAAGLIVTDLHERALAACGRFQLECVSPTRQQVLDEVYAVGAAVLAVRKPKERWTVVDRGYGGNRARRWAIRGKDAIEYEACFNSEAEARAYAARKNAEEDKL